MTLQQKPRPYNTLPRFIAEDYLDKKLTRNEYILCVWLRSLADPYGVTTTSATALRDDMFPSVEVNTVEKILLSLRKKAYVAFPNHRGRRGSVRVQSDEWLIRGRGIKRIAINDPPIQGDAKSSMIEERHTEPSHNLEGQNQSFVEQKSRMTSRISVGSKYDRFTGHHNEHDNEQEQEKNMSASFKGTLTRDFIHRNNEEKRCKEIAIALGEDHMNWFLSILRTDRGFWFIEKAWEVYEEDQRNGKRIVDAPAYFQGVVKKMRTSS